MEIEPIREPWEDWEECDGECETCSFIECREWSERNELLFSKRLKEMAIRRMLREIAEIDEKLRQLDD